MYHIKRAVIKEIPLDDEFSERPLFSDTYELQDLPSAIEFLDRQYKADKALYRKAVSKLKPEIFVDDYKSDDYYSFTIGQVKLKCCITEDITTDAINLFRLTKKDMEDNFKYGGYGHDD